MASMEDLVQGQNRNVTVMSHTIPGHDRWGKHRVGDVDYSFSLNIPSDLKNGRLFVTSGHLSGTIISLPSTGRIQTLGYKAISSAVYDLSLVAGTTMNFTIRSNEVKSSSGGNTKYNRYTIYTSAHISGYLGDVVIPNTIPVTNISMKLINSQLRKSLTSEITLNDRLVRILANKKSGAISFSDFQNKYLVECKVPSVTYALGGRYGSSTSYSSWSSWRGGVDTFGTIDGLHVYLLADVFSGNADAFGIEVRIANKNNPNLSSLSSSNTNYATLLNLGIVYLNASYHGGGNYGGTRTLDRDLTPTELEALGGPNSEIVYQYRIMGNTGSERLYVQHTIILSPETYSN